MTALGYQLSSLKAYLTTPEAVKTTLARLHDIGYRHVQMQWVDPAVPLEATRDALQETGMTCIGTQDSLANVRDHTAHFIRMNTLWGGGSMCVSGFPPEGMTGEGVRALKNNLTLLQQQFQDAGIRLTFHPLWHNYAGALSMPDAVLEAAGGRVGLTLCVHHIVRAGLSPVKVLERFAGHVDICHFKDSALFADGREQLVPIGQGRIDWQPVFSACHATGVRWGLAEQESWQKDAFLCAKEAYDYAVGEGIRPPAD